MLMVAPPTRICFTSIIVLWRHSEWFSHADGQNPVAGHSILVSPRSVFFHPYPDPSYKWLSPRERLKCRARGQPFPQGTSRWGAIPPETVETGPQWPSPMNIHPFLGNVNRALNTVVQMQDLQDAQIAHLAQGVGEQQAALGEVQGLVQRELAPLQNELGQVRLHMQETLAVDRAQVQQAWLTRDSTLQAGLPQLVGGMVQEALVPVRESFEALVGHVARGFAEAREESQAQHRRWERAIGELSEEQARQREQAGRVAETLGQVAQVIPTLRGVEIQLGKVTQYLWEREQSENGSQRGNPPQAPVHAIPPSAVHAPGASLSQMPEASQVLSSPAPVFEGPAQTAVPESNGRMDAPRPVVEPRQM